MEKESKFRDIDLKRDFKILCFRSQKGDFSMVITPEGEKLFAGDKAESQLYSLLALPLHKLESVYWKERDTLIAEAISNISKEIILRVVNNRIYAVVSERFTHIPHREVFQVAETALTELGISYEILRPLVYTSTALYAKFVFNHNQDKVKSGIVVGNSVKGTASISLARFYLVIVCQNGLMDETKDIIFTRVHVGEKEAILAELKDAVSRLVSGIKPINAEEYAIYLPDWQLRLAKLDIAEKYKHSVRDQIKLTMLPGSVTLWSFVNAISQAAQTAPPRTRLQMEILAYQLLSKEVNTDGKET